MRVILRQPRHRHQAHCVLAWAMRSHAIPILWQDESLVAVNKASGLLVHNSRYAGPKERSLRQMLAEQLERPVYPLHRLDRPTSGVVLFVFDRAQFQTWQEQLAAASSEKIYLALVRGHLAMAQTIDHPLRQDKTSRPAHSHVEPLLQSEVERCSLVKIRLETGRRHQARRHLAHISHPLVGDTTYGKGEINRHYRSTYDLHRLALHAWRLHIVHPGTQQPLQFMAPLPPSLWRAFRQLFAEPALLEILRDSDQGAASSAPNMA